MSVHRWLFALVVLCASGSALGAAPEGPRENEDVSAPIRAIFGDQRADFFYPDGLVADQIEQAIGGPPDPLRELGGGVNLISGCRFRSCPEKGAVVAGPGDRIHAIALLHSVYEENPPAREDRMTLFLASDLENDLYRQVLYEWARERDFFGPVDIVYFTQP